MLFVETYEIISYGPANKMFELRKMSGKVFKICSLAKQNLFKSSDDFTVSARNQKRQKSQFQQQTGILFKQKGSTNSPKSILARFAHYQNIQACMADLSAFLIFLCA